LLGSLVQAERPSQPGPGGGTAGNDTAGNDTAGIRAAKDA
jgi:hypothetical protein